MTPAELDALEALAKAATPGPWYDDGYRLHAPVAEGVDPRNGEVIHDYKQMDRQRPDGDWGQEAADAAYIAAMHPQQTLALIAEVKRLRALVEKSGVPHTITVNGEERLYWPLPKDATSGEP